MTTLAQVLHYARFELVRLKWWWVGVLVLIAMTLTAPTAPAGGQMAQLAGGWVVLPVLLPVFIITFAFVMARANVPGDRTAFVGAKPMAWDALPLGYFMQGGLLMSLVSGAAVYAVCSYDVPVRDAVQWLAGPLLGLLLLLLGALQVGMAAASVGRALAVWIGIVVVQAFTAPAIVPMVWFSGSSASLRVIQAVLTVAGVALCLVAYRWPAKRTIARSSGIVFAALAYMGFCADLAVKPAGASGQPLTPVSASLREGVELATMPDWSSGTDMVSLRLSGARADRLYRFEGASVLLQSTDSLGNAGVAKNASKVERTLTATPPAADIAVVMDIPNVSWGDKASSARRTDSPTIYLAGDMHTDLTLPVVTQVEWSGTLVRYRVERLAEAPLAMGELFAVNGSRWRLGRDGPRLALYTASLRSPIGENDRPEFDRDVFVVIDSTRGRAMRVAPSGGSGGGAPFMLPTKLITQESVALRETVVLDELLRSGRSVSIALYRFVEDGRLPVVVRRKVDSWPVRTTPLRPSEPVTRSRTNVIVVPR